MWDITPTFVPKPRQQSARVFTKISGWQKRTLHFLSFLGNQWLWFPGLAIWLVLTLVEITPVRIRVTGWVTGWWSQEPKRCELSWGSWESWGSLTHLSRAYLVWNNILFIDKFCCWKCREGTTRMLLSALPCRGQSWEAVESCRTAGTGLGWREGLTLPILGSLGSWAWRWASAPAACAFESEGPRLTSQKTKVKAPRF